MRGGKNRRKNKSRTKTRTRKRGRDAGVGSYYEMKRLDKEKRVEKAREQKRIERTRARKKATIAKRNYEADIRRLKSLNKRRQFRRENSLSRLEIEPNTPTPPKSTKKRYVLNRKHVSVVHKKTARTQPRTRGITIGLPN